MNDVGRAVRAAYAEAWDSRQRTGDGDERLLTEALRRHEAPPEWVDGSAHDLLVGLWNEGVPPDRLTRSMLRRIPSLVRGALAPLVDVYRLLEDAEALDLSWMAIPEGRRALSEVRHANDLVLRYLHRRVELVPLALSARPTSATLLQRALLVPPTDGEPWREVKAWLAVRATDPVADVMVGDLQVGSCAVPYPAWTELCREAERGVHADGVLAVAHGAEPDEPVVLGELRCYLPRPR